ncbi:hypothetical protein ACFVVM_19970 [Nocardia sp. NPDC058176]|uniref:TRADD-N-associated membrane domain-containing protein n=1 Tax=Nocardia sp. NPDC058176 TaxID=3346368 RepID=UPI0036DB2B80
MIEAFADSAAVLIAAGSTTLGAVYAAVLQLFDARGAAQRVERLNEVIAVAGEHSDIAATGVDDKAPTGAARIDWLESIARERSSLDVRNHAAALQQQRWTTVASLLCGVIAIGVVMFGLLIDNGSDPHGVAAAAAGILPGAASGLLFWQSRSASIRADKFADRISATAARAEALRMSAAILDHGTRDRFTTAVLLSSAFPALDGPEIWRMAEQIESECEADRAKVDEVEPESAPPPAN